MQAVFVSFALFTIVAMPTIAQEVAPTMPAPSIAETDRAQPDWYQQFTFSNNTIESPVWQTQLSQTFHSAWVKSDRWSISVDMTSRDQASPLPHEEMSAGADFLITPRISVGGEVRIGANEFDDTDQAQEKEVEAGIRLRTAFKF